MQQVIPENKKISQNNGVFDEAVAYENNRKMNAINFEIGLSIEAAVGYTDKTQEIMKDLMTSAVSMAPEDSINNLEDDVLNQAAQTKLEMNMERIDDSEAKKDPKTHAMKYIGALYDAMPSNARKELIETLSDESREYIGKGKKTFDYSVGATIQQSPSMNQ